MYGIQNMPIVHTPSIGLLFSSTELMEILGTDCQPRQIILGVQ